MTGTVWGEDLRIWKSNETNSQSDAWHGLQVAAIFYTLFETAKLSGVDPRAFVLTAAKMRFATRNRHAASRPPLSELRLPAKSL